MEFTEHWYTPMHVTGLWPQKLRRGYALGSAMDQDPVADLDQALPPISPDGQLELFA